MTSTSLFTDLPPHLPDELFTTLLEATNVRIEHSNILPIRDQEPNSIGRN